MEFNILWLLIIALFIYLVKENGDKYFRKAVGAILIGLGIFIISPFPGMDDILLYPVFASFIGWEMGLAGFKQNFLPYAFTTTLIGAGIAYLGIYISGYKISYLKNKIKRMFQKYI